MNMNLMNEQMARSAEDIEFSFDILQDPSDSSILREDSLIFERDVQDDPFTFPLPSNTTLTSNSVTNLNNLNNGTNLFKSKSNSTISNSLSRQRTSSESYYNNGNNNNNNYTNVCPPIGIIPNRKLSRTNSYTNTNNGNNLSTSIKSNGSFLNSNNIVQLSTSMSPTSNNVTNIIQHHHHNRRRTMEDSVAPALDASCYIDNNVNDVKVIHSRSSSTIGLDMALGRIRTNSLVNSKCSNTTQNTHNNSSYSNSRSNSNSNNDNAIDDDDDDDDDNFLTTSNNNNKNNFNFNGNDNENTLKFYSYNDLITNEKISNSSTPISMKRPSLGTSFSTSHMKSSPTTLSYIDSLTQSTICNNGTNKSNNPQFFNPFVNSRCSSPYANQSKMRRFSSNNNYTNIITTTTNNTISNPNGNDSILVSPITRNRSYMNKLRNNSGSNCNNISNSNNILLKKPHFHIESSESEDDNDNDTTEVISTIPKHKQRNKSLIIDKK